MTHSHSSASLSEAHIAWIQWIIAYVVRIQWIIKLTPITTCTGLWWDLSNDNGTTLLPPIRVRQIFEWKSNWSLPLIRGEADCWHRVKLHLFGADFHQLSSWWSWISEVLASVNNEFSDSMSSQLILPALYLSSQGPYNLNLMSRQADSITACTGLWRDPSNYNGCLFVVQC